jgi:SPP1 gp7 family putative phage head morphogenesis protein
VKINKGKILRAVLTSGAKKISQLKQDLADVEIIVKASTDTYARYSRTLKTALLNEWNASSRSAINEAIKYLEVNKYELNSETLDYIDKRMATVMGDNFAGAVSGDVTKAVNKTYSFAHSDAVVVAPAFAVPDLEAIAWLEGDAMFWVGSHYEKQTRKRLMTVGKEIIEQGLPRADAAKLLKKRFGQEFKKSDSYWRGLANHVTTRAREFSHVESWVKSKTTYYEIIGVSDFRQTDICREMNGKVFPVEKAVKLKKRIMAASSPEAVKKADRWYKYEEITDWRVEKLPLPMALPPYHFGCRTRTIRSTKES